MLVNIYGSKDLFVSEYRTLLADRILSLFNYDVDREVGMACYPYRVLNENIIILIHIILRVQSAFILDLSHCKVYFELFFLFCFFFGIQPKLFVMSFCTSDDFLYSHP